MGAPISFERYSVDLLCHILHANSIQFYVSPYEADAAQNVYISIESVRLLEFMKRIEYRTKANIRNNLPTRHLHQMSREAASRHMST